MNDRVNASIPDPDPPAAAGEGQLSGPACQRGESEAADRLERRSRSIATLLHRQLSAAASFHDLSRQQLWTVHRNVRDLAKEGGGVPSPAEFWEQTAMPQARNLYDASRAALDSETAELTKALQQYATGVRLELRSVGHGPDDPSLLMSRYRGTAERAVQQVMSATPRPDAINELGAWWQDRLHRRALLKAAWPGLTASISQLEMIVARAEMELLEQAPWSHDDRMLSAFEVIHSDLRDYGLEVERDLHRQARLMLDTVERQELGDTPMTEDSGLVVAPSTEFEAGDRTEPMEAESEGTDSTTIELG